MSPPSRLPIRPSLPGSPSEWHASRLFRCPCAQAGSRPGHKPALWPRQASQAGAADPGRPKPVENDGTSGDERSRKNKAPTRRPFAALRRYCGQGGFCGFGDHLWHISLGIWQAARFVLVPVTCRRMLASRPRAASGFQLMYKRPGQGSRLATPRIAQRMEDGPKKLRPGFRNTNQNRGTDQGGS